MLSLRAPVVLSILLLTIGCVTPSSQVPPTSTGEASQAGTFRVTVIDKDREGSEPSLFIMSDGSIFVCSIRGIGLGTYLWSSLDGGASFRHIGREMSSVLPVLRAGTGDVGGGDCDLGGDTSGRLYVADLWVGGVSVTSSIDKGATWRSVPVSAGVTFVDRPWAVGGDNGEVFVTAAQPSLSGESRGINTPPGGGIWVARSTDGGLTFPQNVLVTGNENRLGLNGNLARDDQNLYLFYTKKAGEGRLAFIVAISGDSGNTWKQQVAAEQAFFPGQCFSPLNVFPVVTTDGAGGVYLAWALENPETNRIDLFMASSRDGGATWNKPVLVTDRAGTRAHPWIAAQGPGRVGLVWYETNVTVLDKAEDMTLYCRNHTPDDAEWHLRYAYSANALDASPRFAEALVQPEPIHNGGLYQPYAEVLQVRFTPDGRAATAYVADVPEGTARPMFAIQAPSS